MIEDNPRQPKEESTEGREGGLPGSGNLVRLLKPIVINPGRGGRIDETVVAPRYYNCFNYSLLSKETTGVSLTVGITSPNQGEGKTLVASNLAVSLAVANQRETVLVDFNVRSPRLHTIFGTKLSPGLVEAIGERTVPVWQTQIEHLYLLSAGSLSGSPILTGRAATGERLSASELSRASIGLDQVSEFRDVIYSLKKEFDFVIVDMPVLQEPRIPVLLTHQMDGLLVVVEAQRTKQEDLDKLMLRVNASQILGFVLNRSEDAY